MSKKVFVITYGCQMNEYDSNKMVDVLHAAEGYEKTQNAEEADLLLLNTCSIREKAQEKVFSELGRWRDWKAANPDRKVGVGGCVASQEGQELLKRAPMVDVLFGPQTLHRLPALLNQSRHSGKSAMDVSFPEIEKFDHLPEPRADGATAFVSIMEGCSKYCTFCVVPYTRGTEVSRPLDDVLTEVALLAEQGVREINLLGQNVNSYLGKTGDGSETCDLAQLLRYLSEIPGIDRLRYTTSHPTHFNEALIEAFAELPKLASYLHLPVQAGSDRILAMMKRGYGRDAFLEKIRRVRQARPGLSISTDIIVGFPSETDEDFALTMDLVREADFDQAYSFIYSPRPGTPAANLKDNVPQAVKDERLQLLQQHIRGRDQAFMRGLYDTVQEVLVERPSRKNPEHMAGRTSSNRWVNFAAPASLIGQFVQVHINDVQPNSLRGVRV